MALGLPDTLTQCCTLYLELSMEVHFFAFFNQSLNLISVSYSASLLGRSVEK